jgi:hypothetical protein
MNAGHVLLATALISSIAGYFFMRRGGRGRWPSCFGAALLFSLVFFLWLVVSIGLIKLFGVPDDMSREIVAFLTPVIAVWIFWVNIRPHL